MSAGEVAAIIAAVAAVVLALAVVLIGVAVVSTLRELKTTLRDVREEALPLLTESREAVRQANGDLTKVSAILDTTRSVTGTVDTASKFAYTVFSSPLIKTSAAASGLAGGLKSLRDKRSKGK